LFHKTAKSSYICHYDSDDLEKTLENHDTLNDDERCLHIRKVQLKQLGVEFYVMADWACYQPQPPRDEECDKEETSSIRATAKKSFKSPVKRSQYITFDLISELSNLLEFKDGSTVDQKSIFRYRPYLVLSNIYPKTKKTDTWTKSFEVRKHSTDQITFAPINVSIDVWEGEPEKSTSHSLNIPMKLALPPIQFGMNHPPNNMDTERSNLMDQNLMALIAAWLLPPLAKGSLEFSKAVGKGLGDNFVKLIDELLANAVGTKSEKDKPTNLQHDYTNVTPEIFINALRNQPQKAEQIYTELRTALSKLLRNTLKFTKSNISNELVPDMGYVVGQFDATTQASLANSFVEQVFADNKVFELIENISEMKPYLFDEEHTS